MAFPAATLQSRLPWPLQFVRGLLYLGRSLKSDAFTGYMLGRKIRGWVPGYFPLAWAIKFPIPLKALTAAGLAAFAIRVWRTQAGSHDPLIWGSASFFGTAMLSNFHISLRHALPALPFLILGGPDLADSNIDWGQNLPELGAYQKRNHIATVDTFISSFDNPWHHCWPGSLARLAPLPNGPENYLWIFFEIDVPTGPDIRS